jgi:hypothetical protein
VRAREGHPRVPRETLPVTPMTAVARSESVKWPSNFTRGARRGAAFSKTKMPKYGFAPKTP